ncbi:hypothetical protein Bbelb_189090 [Branchiostoma belcheri]|nr:hypothetical protein Bbelb_189090 [Branchiostoma belcheri]
MLEDGCVLKCRRCRLSLVTGHSIVSSHGNGESCPMEGLSTLWYISDNHIPDWVQEQITQVQWTKGRLLCPKCAGRLGSFDFVSLVKCPCGDQVFPPIHIQRCRVDVDKLSPKHVPKTQQGEKLPTDDTPARTGVTAARTGVTAARTGDAPTEKADAHGKAAEMDSSISDAHVGSSSGSTSTSDEEESSDQTYTWTSVSSQRPLVVADDDDSVGRVGRRKHRKYCRQTEDQAANKEGQNKLKNIRKKQRRHEKWVKKQTQEEENLEEAEREGLICPICLDLYYEPYVCQPCGHVFCDPCLRQIAKDNPGCTACPLCRTVVITVNFSYLPATCRAAVPPPQLASPGVTGARALWWTTVTSLTSHRAGRNYPHYRSNDDDLNYDGSMFDELLVYFYSVNWVIGLFVVCGLCYFSIRSFIF